MVNWSCSSSSICGQRILGAALGALGTELAWAFAAAQVEHVPFLEALERRLVAQFWDSFGRTVAVQRRFDAAVLTAIAAYADRFICRLRRGKLQLLAWAISRATRDIPVWMLSSGVCSVHRLEATESSLQDGPFGRQGHLHRQSGCSGSFERLGDTAKAVAGVFRVEAARAGRLHRELWRLLRRCGRL